MKNSPQNDFAENPLVSIIINCFNCEKYLREAIDSVFAQTYKNWEIIFWDNGSSDNSPDIAKSYDCRLIYFRDDQTVPLYAARNLALNKCNGDAIAFLDSDDIWCPGKLSQQVEALTNGERFIYGGYAIINEHGEPTAEVVDLPLSNKPTNDLLMKNPISIGCVLIEAELIKRYKFDAYYDLLGDFDLWVRLSLECSVHTVGGVVEYSRQHSENTSIRLKKKWLAERRYFYRKFMRLGSILKYPEIIRYFVMTEIKGLLGRV